MSGQNHTLYLKSDEYEGLMERLNRQGQLEPTASLLRQLLDETSQYDEMRKIIQLNLESDMLLALTKFLIQQN